MIVSFTTSRISLKRIGITPEPGSPHTRSKSIFTASQFVMPPAKPKSPAASTHRLNSRAPLPGAVVAFSSMPTAIMKKVQQFEIEPLFRYGRSTFAIRAFSGRASIGRGTSLLRVPFGRSDDATRGMPDASSEEEFARGRWPFSTSLSSTSSSSPSSPAIARLEIRQRPERSGRTDGRSSAEGAIENCRASALAWLHVLGRKCAWNQRRAASTLTRSHYAAATRRRSLRNAHASQFAFR